MIFRHCCESGFATCDPDRWAVQRKQLDLLRSREQRPVPALEDTATAVAQLSHEAAGISEAARRPTLPVPEVDWRAVERNRRYLRRVLCEHPLQQVGGCTGFDRRGKPVGLLAMSSSWLGRVVLDGSAVETAHRGPQLLAQVSPSLRPPAGASCSPIEEFVVRAALTPQGLARRRADQLFERARPLCEGRPWDHASVAQGFDLRLQGDAQVALTRSGSFGKLALRSLAVCLKGPQRARGGRCFWKRSAGFGSASWGPQWGREAKENRCVVLFGASSTDAGYEQTWATREAAEAAKADFKLWVDEGRNPLKRAAQAESTVARAQAAEAARARPMIPTRFRGGVRLKAAKVTVALRVGTAGAVTVALACEPHASEGALLQWHKRASSIAASAD